MTPKEQTIDIFYKYFQSTNDHNIAKQCTLLAVDYIIQCIYQIDHKHTAVYDNKGTFYTYKECQELRYWQEVKQEIEKL